MSGSPDKIGSRDTEDDLLNQALEKGADDNNANQAPEKSDDQDGADQHSSSYDAENDEEKTDENTKAYEQASEQVHSIINNLVFSDDILQMVDEFNPSKIIGKSDIKTFIAEQEGLLSSQQLISLKGKFQEAIQQDTLPRWEREQQAAYERGLIEHKPNITSAMELSSADISNNEFKDKASFEQAFLQRGYLQIDSKYPEGHPFRKLLEEHAQNQIDQLHERWKELNQAENQKEMLQRIQTIKERARTMSFSKKEVERKADFWEKPELFSAFARKEKLSTELSQLIALKDQLPKEHWEAAKREIKAHLEAAPLEKWKAQYVKIEEERLQSHTREAERALKLQAEDFKNEKYLDNPKAFETMILKRVGKLGLIKLEKHQRMRFEDHIKRKAAILQKDWEKGFQQQEKLKLLYAEDELKKTIAAIDPKQLNESDLKTELAFHQALEKDPQQRKIRSAWAPHHQDQLNKKRELLIAEQYIKIQKAAEKKKTEEKSSSPEELQKQLGEKLLNKLKTSSLPYRSLHSLQGKNFGPFYSSWSTILGESQFGLFLRDVQGQNRDPKAFLQQTFSNPIRINAITKLRSTDPSSWKHFEAGIRGMGYSLTELLNSEGEPAEEKADLLEEDLEVQEPEEDMEKEEMIEEEVILDEEETSSPEGDENPEEELILDEEEASPLEEDESPEEDLILEEEEIALSEGDGGSEETDEIEEEEEPNTETPEHEGEEIQEKMEEDLELTEVESSEDEEEQESEPEDTEEGLFIENEAEEAKEENSTQQEEVSLFQGNGNPEASAELEDVTNNEAQEETRNQPLTIAESALEDSGEHEKQETHQTASSSTFEDLVNNLAISSADQADEEDLRAQEINDQLNTVEEVDEDTSEFPELTEMIDITENLDKVTELNALMDFINEDFQDINWLLENIQQELMQQLAQVDISEQKKQLMLERQQGKKSWWEQFGIELNQQDDFDLFFDNFSGDMEVIQVIQLFLHYVHITTPHHVTQQTWCPKHLQNRIVEHPQEVFWSLVGHLEGLASPAPLSNVIIHIHQPAPRKEQERICFTLSLETAGERSKRHHEADLKTAEEPRSIATEILKNFQDYLSQSDELREAQITKLMEQLNTGAYQEPFQNTRQQLMDTMIKATHKES